MHGLWEHAETSFRIMHTADRALACRTAQSDICCTCLSFIIMLREGEKEREKYLYSASFAHLHGYILKVQMSQVWRFKLAEKRPLPIRYDVD